jgi:hypothetical protein
VSASVRGPDGKCTVQHTSEKDKPVAGVPGLIAPVAPDRGAARVAFAGRRWHDEADHDSHEPDAHTHCGTRIGNSWEDALAEENNGADRPRDTEKGNEDVPSVHNEVRVI